MYSWGLQEFYDPRLRHFMRERDRDREDRLWGLARRSSRGSTILTIIIIQQELEAAMLGLENGEKNNDCGGKQQQWEFSNYKML